MSIMEKAETYAFYFTPEREEKYWIFPDGDVEEVDNHDSWAEDEYAGWAKEAGVSVPDDEDGIHDGSSCLYAGFVRVNISHYQNVGVEVNVGYTPDATKRARSMAANYIKDYKEIANQFVVGNICYTDWRLAIRAIRT